MFQSCDLRRRKSSTETSKYYDDKHAVKQSQPFNRKEVEMLFKDVLARINKITDERFKVTDEYKVDLVAYIECLWLSQDLEKMHENYCKIEFTRNFAGKEEEIATEIFS